MERCNAHQDNVAEVISYRVKRVYLSRLNFCSSTLFLYGCQIKNYMKKKVKLGLIMFFIIGMSSVHSQDLYRTQKASMLITGVSNDSTVLIQSKDASVSLDYNTAKFTLRVEKSSFVTGNSNLDSLLSTMNYQYIVINGQLGIEYVITSDHPPLEFNVEGTVESSQSEINGIGHLEHIADGGSISCILNLNFMTTFSDLNFQIVGFDLNEEIQIDILQAILSNEE